MYRLTLMFLIFGLAWEATVAADPPAEIEQELRIVWGGTQARSYVGSIAISDGSLMLLRNLSMQDNSLGVVQQNDSKTIRLQQQAATNFGGCDVALRAGISSRIKLLLRDAESGKVYEQTVNLADVQQKSWVQAVDDSGSRIAIERQSYDRLRVENPQGKPTIFECDSVWTPRISGYRTGLPEGEYQLAAHWANSRSNSVALAAVKVDVNGDFSPIQLQVRIPAAEGAQRLELSLARSSLMSAISGPKPLLSRSVDVVAFDPSIPPQGIGQWSPLLAIDTAAAVKPEGLAWLTTFTGSIASRVMDVPESLRLPGVNLTEQLNRLIPFSRAAANYGAVSKAGIVGVRPTVAANGSDGERTTIISSESWVLLPLSGLHPNQPHRLRIQVPIDQPSSLSISVRDTGNDRDLLLEPQSSVEIKGDECHSGESITHEMLFWPRSESIELLLASAGKTQSALVGKILVETGEFVATKSSDVGEGRQIAVYVDQPLLVESLGAPREKDPQSGRYYETWKTWQAVAERLTLQMQLAGANTLVLSGISGGNSLVELDSVSQQHRLDKGIFFGDSRSPGGHDFIELLLLHFDRAGYQLILEADFPSADQFRSSIGNEIDSEQVDLLKGTSRLIGGGEPATSSRLNPLNRAVQKALTQPLKEIVEQYRSHGSFAGVSLRLDSNSQFLFAGDRWGYNDSLLKEFAADNSLTIPEDLQQRMQLFTGSARLRFVKWRAQQMADYFSSLVQTLQSIQQDLPLYVNLVRISERLPSESDFVEPEVVARNPQQTMLSYGLDLESLTKINGLRLAHGVVQHSKQLPGPSDWLRGSNIDASLTQQSALHAMLVTHQPRALKLSPEADKPQSLGTDRWIYPDSIRQGSYARRILLEQLWSTDPLLLAFGSWHPVWIGDADVNSLLAAYKTLPPVRLKDVDLFSNESPLRIRTVTERGVGYLSLMNLSPWPIVVVLQTAAPADQVEVSTESAGTIAKTQGGLTVQIPAYDLMVLKSQNPRELDVEAAEYRLPEQSAERTAQRIQKLESLLAQAADPGQQEVLFRVGGSFEQWTSNNKPVGWNISTLPLTTIQRAAELPRSGSYSLLIENRGEEPITAWIQSAPIDPPETGRLTLRAWLRASAADQSPPKVRLGLIGRTATGERYQRSIVFGGSSKDSSRFLSNDWGRRPAELHVADVPVDDLVELQVAIDLIGVGRIWVDDVEVVQSWLHPDERNYLRGQLLVVKEKLTANNPYPAERLLRSPMSQYLFELSSRKDSATLAPLMSPHSEEVRSDWNRTKPALQQFRDSMRGRWNR